MANRLYLSDAFGWETEWTAKVAISQLREEHIINTSACPKAQLIKNGSYRWMPNVLKILGYIPIINVVAGIIVFFVIEDQPYYRPSHKQLWELRGVAMIFTGPLLMAVDLIKFIYDCTVAAKYCQENERIIARFDTPHEHSPSYWPGHPIFCNNREEFYILP
jgi:hypothetical protein